MNAKIADSDWRYGFHGLELDAASLHDERFVRLELGPRGMTNVFSAWSIGIFVVSAQRPWPLFPNLRVYLDDRPRWPNFQRTCELFDELERDGCFVVADREVHELVKKYTRKSDGHTIVDIPIDLRPEVASDIWLCDRYVLNHGMA